MPMNPKDAPCDGCGRLFHIDELDGKDDGSGNFNILECRDCYGPGWVPGPSHPEFPTWNDGSQANA